MQKDTVLQVHLLGQVHFTGDGGEDEALLSAVRQRELDLPVQTARSEQGRVQSVGSVCCHDDLRSKKHNQVILKIMSYRKWEVLMRSTEWTLELQTQIQGLGATMGCQSSAQTLGPDSP